MSAEPGRWYVRESGLAAHIVLSHEDIGPGTGTPTLCGRAPGPNGWHTVARRPPEGLCYECRLAWDTALLALWKEGKAIAANRKLVGTVIADQSTGGKPSRRFAVHAIYGTFNAEDTMVTIELNQDGSGSVHIMRGPDNEVIRSAEWPREASQTHHKQAAEA